jgi:predicted alpha-1,2-mannosidase
MKLICLALLMLACCCSSMSMPKLPICFEPKWETESLRAQRHALDPYVDPFIGTGGDGYGSGGLPMVAQMPFGNVRLGPDTIRGDVRVAWRETGGYSYCDNEIRAFSHTHLVGAGAMDLGNVGVQALVNISEHRMQCFRGAAFGDEPRFCEYKQRFDKSSELAEPGAYGVVLNDPSGVDIMVNLSATEYVGVHRYTFGSGGGDGVGSIVVDPCHMVSIGVGACRNSSIEFLPSASSSAPTKFAGSVFNYGDFSKRFGGQMIYFYGEMGSADEIRAVGTWRSGSALMPGATWISGAVDEDVGIYMTLRGSTASLALAISYVSADNAVANFESANVRGVPLETIKSRARDAWQRRVLGRVRAKGGTQEQRIKFYSALYHAHMAPTLWTEANGQYVAADSSVRRSASPVYTDLSIWDTARHNWPMLVMLQRDVALRTVESMMNAYELVGSLPKWQLMGRETGSMEGLFATTMITDALQAWTLAWAESPSGGALNASALLDAAAASLRAHEGAGYLRDGYVSKASRSLCFAQNDFCVAQLASMVGRADVDAAFRNTSASWRNLWNARVKYICARNASDGGSWVNCDKPLFVPVYAKYPFNDQYTEGDAEQYRWFVHDTEALIDKLGGPHRFVERLERFFSRSMPLLGSNVLPNPYYWAGNEIDVEAPDLFLFANRTDLARYYSHYVIDRKFSVYSSGVPGNDDYGEMSAQLVLRSLGLAPMHCRGQFGLTLPVFDSVVVTLLGEGGPELHIVKHPAIGAASPAALTTFNGKPIDRFIGASVLLQGGLLEFFQ